MNNSDHKHSFTAYEKSDMPENVVVKDFLDRFRDWVEVIDIRENLMNYHFDWPKEIDQTRNFEDRICAQIDFIVRKKDMALSAQWRKENDRKWLWDYWTVMFPIQTKEFLRTHLPKPIKTFLKQVKNALVH